MPVDSILFQVALGVARPAKVGHGLYPRAKRKRTFKNRATLPKEIFPACEIHTAIFWLEPVRRKRWDHPVIIARRMGQLKPTQFPPRQGLYLLRFMLAQTLGRTVHPNAAARQSFPALHSAGPNDLIRFRIPIIRQSIGFGNPGRLGLSSGFDRN